MKKISSLIITVLFVTVLSFANTSSKQNEIPSEETQAFCYEYALTLAGGSYEIFGAAYDECCG